MFFIPQIRRREPNVRSGFGFFTPQIRRREPNGSLGIF
jgi:hypothetical protein